MQDLVMMQQRQRALASLLCSGGVNGSANNGFAPILPAGWPGASAGLQMPFNAGAGAAAMASLPDGGSIAAGPTTLAQLQLLRALTASQIANSAVATPQASISLSASRGSKRSAKDDKPMRPRKRGRPSYKDRAAAALAAEAAAKAAKAAALAEREILLRQITAQMSPQAMLLQQQLMLQQLGMFGANQIGGFNAAMCGLPPPLAHMGTGVNAGPAARVDNTASGAAASRQFCSSDADFARLDSSAALDQSRQFGVTANDNMNQWTEDIETHRHSDGRSGDDYESDYNGDASSCPWRGKKQTLEAPQKPLTRAGGSSVTEDGTQAALADAQAAANQVAPSGVVMAPPPSSAGPGGMPALAWMFSKDTRFVQPKAKDDLEEHADEHIPAAPAMPSHFAAPSVPQQQQQQAPAVVVAAAMQMLAQAMPCAGSRQVMPSAGFSEGFQGMGAGAGMMGLSRARSNIEAVIALVDAEIQARRGRDGEGSDSLPSHLVPAPVRGEVKARNELDLTLHL